MTGRTLFVATLLALSLGCSCEDEQARPHVSHAPAPPTSVAPAAPVDLALPSALRTDLALATPAVVVEVTGTAYRVSNAALLDSWPAADRAAVMASPPPNDPAWPRIERHIRSTSDALMVPPLGAALFDAASVDHARSEANGTQGTPLAFAIRAQPDVPFGRVLAAVFAGGMNGYAAPQLVLASPRGDVVLPISLPTNEPPPSAPTAAEIDQLVHDAVGEGVPPPDPTDVPPPPPPAPLVLFRVAPDGVIVRRGDTTLAPGCDSPAPDGTVAISMAALTARNVEVCLRASGATGRVMFSAPADMRYGQVLTILEPIAAFVPVAFAVDASQLVRDDGATLVP
jgi:hypothetical protein